MSKNILYQVEFKNYTKELKREDCPQIYRIISCDECTCGIMIEGYYPDRKKWIENPQTKHLICHLLFKK